MKNALHTPIAYACATFVAVLVAGCGGGGGDSTPPAPTTTDLTITVIDGAIENALVCIDKNSNGVCDDGDTTRGRTDATGKVTLVVPNADLNQYAVVAVVGTDAKDADHGPVLVPYTMSTPDDQPGLVSPLTTLVQQTAASTGSSTTAAAKLVADATGIATSLFQDYRGQAVPDGTASAAAVARLVVLATQQQATALLGATDLTAIDGKPITQGDVDKAVQKKVLALLPALATALSEAGATSEAALAAAASGVVAASGLTLASLPVVVAVNNQSAGAAPPADAPSAFILLNSLSFTDASNYFMRLLTGTLANNTPDADNKTRFVDRRIRSNSGNVAKWSTGSDPARNSDLHWNGTAWVGCPINFESTSSVRDAKGNSAYDYCSGGETGKSTRAAFDIVDKTMAQVYADIRAAGFTNLTITNAEAVLGSAVFPAGSKVLYQTSTPVTAAFAYQPAGAENAAGFSNVLTQYSAAVAGGGDAAAQAAGTACNSPETTGSGSRSTTLEGMVAVKGGTPCIFGPGSFSYGGATYTSGPQNDWWGNSTVSLGKLGSAPVNSGPAPGFYTTNTHLRIAFKGSGTNPVTYYACKERFNNGSPRNCTAIGTGTYAIQTLGDGRAMTFTNPPALAAPLTYQRVFVERGGFVYFGYQGKPNSTDTARLNTIGSTALLAQLGVPAEDPSVPMALTAGSYQGTWDLRDSNKAVSPTVGVTVFINANGNVSCQDRENSAFEACSVTFTDLATGAFTYANGASTAAGTLAFMTGAASGTYHDPSAVPMDGNFVGGRR